MKLQRLLIVLVAAAMLLSMAACAAPTAGATTAAATTAEATTAAATTAAATTTAATTAAETEPAAPVGDVTIRTSFTAGEFTDDIIALAEKEMPGIKVERAEADETKLMAMIAAGTAPDIIRIYAAQTLPMWVTRNIAASIQDRIDKSTVIDESDLLPICDTCRWDGKVSGQGPLYGIPKDWSLDIAVMISKKQFNDMGIPIPDEKTPLTIAEYVDLAKQLNELNEDGTVKVYGCGDDFAFNLMLLQSMMNQQGLSIWSDDYRKVNLNNDNVKEIFSYIYDAAINKVSGSPINPLPSYAGDVYKEGKLAMWQVGYWFTGNIRGYNQTAEQKEDRLLSQEDCMMLPALMIKSDATRISTCTHACSGILLKQSEHPDEAWKVFEWFLGPGVQAQERAKGGWGLPSYRSLMDLLPNETDFDKQALAVTMDEIDKSAKLYVQMNPFVNYAGAETLIKKYIDPIYSGDSTIDEALPQLERDIQLLIEEGMEIAGII